MSTSLSPDQFPFYNQHSSKYDPGTKVDPERYGLPVQAREEGLRLSMVKPPHEIDIPLDRLRAGQDWVRDKHVANLATVPREAFERIHAVPDVREHSDGTYRINEGTHRAAAAHVRGDTTIRVRVTGRWDKA